MQNNKKKKKLRRLASELCDTGPFAGLIGYGPTQPSNPAAGRQACLTSLGIRVSGTRDMLPSLKISGSSEHPKVPSWSVSMLAHDATTAHVDRSRLRGRQGSARDRDTSPHKAYIAAT